MFKNKNKNFVAKSARIRFKQDVSTIELLKSVVKEFKIPVAGFEPEIDVHIFIELIRRLFQILRPIVIACTFISCLYLTYFFIIASHIRLLCSEAYKDVCACSYDAAVTKYMNAMRYCNLPLVQQTQDLCSLFSRNIVPSENHIKIQLAKVYTKQGDFDEAKHLYEQIFLLQQQQAKDKHIDASTQFDNKVDLAETMRGRGVLAKEQGEWELSESLLKKAKVIQEEIFDPNDLRLADTMDDLGILYIDEQRLEEAQFWFEKAQRVRKRYVNNNLAIATSLNNLGTVYREEGRLKEAKITLESSKNIFTQLYGPNYPYVTVLLHKLALVYKDMGKLPQAEASLKQVLNIDTKRLGFRSLETAQAMDNLAGIYQAENRLTLAEPLCRKSLQIETEICGPNNLLASSSMQHLGSIYTQQHRYTEAEYMLNKTIQIRQAALGPNSPEVADTTMCMGDLNFQQGNFSRAESCYRKALLIDKKALDPNNIQFIEMLGKLELLLNKTERTHESKSIRMECQRIKYLVTHT